MCLKDKIKAGRKNSFAMVKKFFGCFPSWRKKKIQFEEKNLHEHFPYISFPLLHSEQIEEKFAGYFVVHSIVV